jgi:aminobenzoyl-glutamate utilization protein B
MEWYAGELLAQPACMRMFDLTSRRALTEDPNLRGVIYNTVKFCDFYSFEYAALRDVLRVPMLKIETDYTPQGAAQVLTRLQAFFEGMDALLAWHPGGPTSVLGNVWPLTYMSMVFEFKVESAAGGQSGDVSYPGALDAAVLMYNNVNTMKEHMPALTRRGGSINEFMMTGGQCTVSTPEFSQLVYAWRTNNLPDQYAIRKTIERCAQGAAVAADCKVEPRLLTAVRTGLPNKTLSDVVLANLKAHGPNRYTEEDKAFAREIQKNLGHEETEQPYDISIIEPEKAYGAFHPADDVNEFTWHAPTARLYVSKAMKRGLRYPRWVESALCGMGATHRMGETAAKVLASSAIDLLNKPETLEAAKTEYDKRKREHWEMPLIPADVKPPISLRWPEWVSRPGSEWWIPPPGS